MKTKPIAMGKTLRLLCFMLTCLGVHQLNGQSCNTTTMFGLTGAGEIYPITMSTASVGARYAAATSGASGSNALGYNPVNGKYYFWASTYSARTQTRDSCVGKGQDRICYPITTTTVSSDSLFVSFDPATNTYATLSSGNSPGFTTIRTGCVSADGSGYYCLNNNGALWYYNIAGDNWTAIDSVWQDDLGNDLSSIIAAQTSGDMSIDGNGNLWLLTAGATSYGVYRLNAPLPTTSGASLVLNETLHYSTPNPDSKTIAGIAFSALGEIYISSLSDSLYIMDHNLEPAYVGTFTTTNVGNDLTSCQFPLTVLQPVTPLPLKFSSFDGRLMQDHTVQLWWDAQTDETHQYFEVERSNDGLWFSGIGKSNLVPPYQFVDGSPNAGINYYRIKSVDKSGKSSYSKIIPLNLNRAARVALFPNPASEALNILLNTKNAEEVTITVSDLQGRVVLRQNTAALGGKVLKLDISSWKPQFYIVTLYNSKAEVIATEKIVKY